MGKRTSIKGGIDGGGGVVGGVGGGGGEENSPPGNICSLIIRTLVM